MAKRFSDVAAIQDMPNRKTDSTKFGMWVAPLEPTPRHTDGPCVGDEKISTAVGYLNRK